MRIAIIRDGLVVNVIEADGAFDPGDGTLAAPAEEAGPGWTYDGAKFTPPPDVVRAPDAVSMFQAREALRRTERADGGNLLDAVGAFVDSQRTEQPTLALAWEYATEVERRGVFVTTLAAKFGLDDAALDELFRRAATISA